MTAATDIRTIRITLDFMLITLLLRWDCLFIRPKLPFFCVAAIPFRGIAAVIGIFLKLSVNLR